MNSPTEQFHVPSIRAYIMYVGMELVNAVLSQHVFKKKLRLFCFPLCSFYLQLSICPYMNNI